MFLTKVYKDITSEVTLTFFVGESNCTALLLFDSKYEDSHVFYKISSRIPLMEDHRQIRIDFTKREN